MSAELQKTQGILDAALEISARRAETLREIKSLILAGDELKAMKLLKQYLGIQERKLKLIK